MLDVVQASPPRWRFAEQRIVGPACMHAQLHDWVSTRVCQFVFAAAARGLVVQLALALAPPRLSLTLPVQAAAVRSSMNQVEGLLAQVKGSHDIQCRCGARCSPQFTGMS